MRWPWLLLLGVLLGGCNADEDGRNCQVHLVASLPLLTGGPLPAVEASLDGRKVVFYVDTGAVTSLVTPEAVRQFDLYAGFSDGRATIRGIGGPVSVPIVTIHSLVLGHGLARNIALPVAGELGGPVQGMPVIGLFGADFLSNYDVDVDLPGHHFGLYDLQGCGRDIQPIAPPFFEVPFRLENTKIVLDLKLDDTPMTAFLDSGAMRTLVSRDDARRAGVTTQAMAGDRAGRAIGIDANPVDMRLHRFASLEIGSERMHNFPFAVGDIDDSLLGGDFLRFNRVWISYPRRKLFIRPSLKPAGITASPPA